MTWDAYHRRKKTLREVLAVADRRRDLTLTEMLDLVDPERQGIAERPSSCSSSRWPGTSASAASSTAWWQKARPPATSP
ncbi:hypothetical protein [Aeromicrobium sp. UC242_57]|uniref:hypothetical protein n=1 Tax=Aeromicrobium sp. UC242_57 TaxID=3374624 RepID=UPI0037B64CA8